MEQNSASYHLNGAQRGSYLFGHEYLEKPARTPLDINEHGFVSLSTIDTLISRRGAYCSCEVPCKTNTHHMLFTTDGVQQYIDDIDDPDSAELHRSFYQSPFAKVDLPVCEHQFIQDSTFSIYFPEANVMNDLMAEYQILRRAVTSVLSHRGRYHRRLQVDFRGRIDTVRDLKRQGDHDRYAALRRELGLSGYGVTGTMQAIKSALSAENRIFTPGNLAAAGSLFELGLACMNSRQLRNVNSRSSNDRYAQPYRPNHFDF